VKSIITKQNGLYSHGFGYTFSLFPDNTMVQLFFGAINIIDFNNYRFNDLKPVVEFNVVKVMNKEYLQEAIKNNFTISLSHNQNFLQFEFAALLFNNTNQLQYLCKLDGADNDWVYLGQTNTTTYSGLKPGQYTFRVKAANNDGQWGDESVIIINIKKPLYARWWFILTAVALISLLMYWWSRQRVLQAKKEEKLKARYQQQIAETELKALRAQMNPHFIFNSLNSIQKYILKNEHFEASQYLTKFSRLIRLILDHSNQNTVLLSSELEMLKLYTEMESLRFENKFDYSINIDPAISADTVEIPSMLIQPFVENAIWHGLLHLPADKDGNEQKGKLSIRFSKTAGNYIDVEIEDNGIGRKKAAELKSKQVLRKKSYGMQITEKRIAAINQVQGINAAASITDKEDKYGNATGTLVKLTIPLTTLNS
jgi:two-component sensor histidine kinase